MGAGHALRALPGLLLPLGLRFCPLAKGHQVGEGDKGVKATAQSSLETLILHCVVGEREEEGDWEGKGWRAGGC